ncbi:TetR/AcrR family transcriptional regulator [Kineococcus auxinigenes]|uniref:TetR/AcrR family transcriptional regulator n=1 Tax=unclassified Kineococcus TaxID=2621656 RepID=UPI003D7E12D2
MEPDVTRKGRPPATTRAHVARTALALFTEHGYEATTMQDVAAAVGITRRSLFRYFDSKAAVVWHGEQEAARAVADEIAALGEDVPWPTGVVRAVLAALRFPDDDLDALRLRLRLVSGVPELRAHLVESGEASTGLLASYVAARTGRAADDLEPLTLARAVRAASTTGLIWWAENPGAGTDPRTAVRRALSALGLDG